MSIFINQCVICLSLLMCLTSCALLFHDESQWVMTSRVMKEDTLFTFSLNLYCSPYCRNNNRLRYGIPAHPSITMRFIPLYKVIHSAQDSEPIPNNISRILYSRHVDERDAKMTTNNLKLFYQAFLASLLKESWISNYLSKISNWIKIKSSRKCYDFNQSITRKQDFKLCIKNQ